MLTLAIFEWKIAPPVRGSVNNIETINPSKIGAIETIEFTLEFARSGYYIPEWDGISGINHRLWYDLYFEMIQNPAFNYEAAVEDIAAFSRRLISQRP
jgi:multiple sugar transport system substrate-binding protein